MVLRTALIQEKMSAGIASVWFKTKISAGIASVRYIRSGSTSRGGKKMYCIRFQKKMYCMRFRNMFGTAFDSFFIKVPNLRGVRVRETLIRFFMMNRYINFHASVKKPLGSVIRRNWKSKQLMNLHWCYIEDEWNTREFPETLCIFTTSPNFDLGNIRRRQPIDWAQFDFQQFSTMPNL